MNTLLQYCRGVRLVVVRGCTKVSWGPAEEGPSRQAGDQITDHQTRAEHTRPDREEKILTHFLAAASNIKGPACFFMHLSIYLHIAAAAACCCLLLALPMLGWRSDNYINPPGGAGGLRQPGSVSTKCLKQPNKDKRRACRSLNMRVRLDDL